MAKLILPYLHVELCKLDLVCVQANPPYDETDTLRLASAPALLSASLSYNGKHNAEYEEGQSEISDNASRGTSDIKT
ncbi:hypothetical protein M514_05614 [Trichuris suis]|uniref:Uncharacterized protein n=1 Tax=Trichuris suis TaxID=68888 RepID=A0A085M8G2_9BILA|nr:hypothetical protein M513_05614 [Trichuris suis]KFD71821.1 hypothetical protein M514_05614 [Trichuris suis]